MFLLLLQNTERLVEPYLCQFHVDFRIDLLALCLLPGSLGCHHISYLHHSFLESDRWQKKPVNEAVSR